ncbi:MAG TPA: OmpA family protein, partial [Polyangiaceae bacterium]|nr:OmpA family protein [Polyangiaceae bacterium]
MFEMKRSACILLFVSAAGCASSPPSSLVDARAAYQRASNGPARELAPAQLHAAQVSLTLAERTYDDEGGSDNARDRAYVALRKAELAEVHAEIAEQTRRVAQAEERGEVNARQEHAATRQELEQTREQLNAEIQRRQEAEQAQQRALAALGDVKKESRGTVLTIPGNVIFASGKAEVLTGAKNRLAQVAQALKDGDTESKIVVEGHTDATGSTASNEQLSMKRAEAVRDALVSDGVPAERITVMGYGESRPLADNASPAGRATNRRVEIVVQPA